MAANVLALTKGMSREEWLEVRRQGIGGSDAAAIAGVSSFASALSIYMDKVQPREEPEPETDAQHFGNILEDVVAREFSRRTGLKVWRRNAVLSHPEYPWMLANIDRLVPDAGAGTSILEVKTRSHHARRQWDDGVPLDITYQVQHYLAVTGYRTAFVAVLIGGVDYRHFTMERDQGFIDYLITLEHDFWHEHVLPGIPPAPDGSVASTVSLSRLYETAILDKEVILPDGARQLVRELREAKLVEKAAGNDVARLENLVKAAMGDAEVAYLPGIPQPVATWNASTRTSIDTKALRAAEPEIARRFEKTTPTRTFRLTLKEN